MEIKDIVDKNPQIDRKVIADFQRITDHLIGLGIDMEPRYSIEPPLGGNIPSVLSNKGQTIKLELECIMSPDK
jgi:hypothetical protein